MEVDHSLDKEKIGAQSDITMVFQNGRGDGFGNKRGRTGGRDGACGLTLDDRDIRAVDDERTLGVVGGNRAVADQVFFGAGHGIPSRRAVR